MNQTAWRERVGKFVRPLQIIVAALATGSAFLAVALIVAIVLHMPTRSSVAHWIEDQLRLLDEERSMAH